MVINMIEKNVYNTLSEFTKELVDNLDLIISRVPQIKYTVKDEFVKNNNLLDDCDLNEECIKAINELIEIDFISSYSIYHDMVDHSKKSIVLKCKNFKGLKNK